MAFNNIYNPYGYYPNQYGNQFNQNTQINQYAYVNGVEGAKSYQVQPNQTMLLMDSDNPLIYMKQANAMGQSTLKYYKIEEINENALKTLLSSGCDNLSHEDKNTLEKAITTLKNDFDTLSKRVDALYNKRKSE